MNETLLAGFGSALKAAREVKSLTIADVSDKIKLSQRQVEAIEAEDLEHLPQGVYLRGFVRNYAKLVGVDAESLIVPVDVQATVADTITAKNEGVRLVSKGVKRWLVVPILIMVLFLFLVGVLYEWLRSGEGMTVSQSVTWQSAPPVVMPVAVESALPSLAVMPVDLASVLPSALPSMEASVAPTSMLAVVAPVASPSALVPQIPASAVPAPQVSLSSGTHSLRFEVGQAAWISIVDAKGQRFSKLVPTGGREAFRGEPPFRLVVGEASQVKLTYDGHLIDLSPYIGQKVARLTLE